MNSRDLRDFIAAALSAHPETTEIKAIGKQINAFFGNKEYEIVIRTTRPEHGAVLEKDEVE